MRTGEVATGLGAVPNARELVRARRPIPYDLVSDWREVAWRLAMACRFTKKQRLSIRSTLCALLVLGNLRFCLVAPKSRPRPGCMTKRTTVISAGQAAAVLQTQPRNPS